MLYAIFFLFHVLLVSYLRNHCFIQSQRLWGWPFWCYLFLVISFPSYSSIQQLQNEHESEAVVGTREGTFRSAYLSRDQRGVIFFSFCLSLLTNLSCIYEKIPKIPKINKPRILLEVEGIFVLSFFFPLHPRSVHTQLSFLGGGCFSFMTQAYFILVLEVKIWFQGAK